MNNNAVILYMPVVHSGYITFIEKFKDAEFFLFDEGFVKNNFPEYESRFARDIRSVDLDKIIFFLQGAFPDMSFTKIGSKDEILEIQKKYSKVVLPEEDISIKIKELFSEPNNIELKPFFLRWDGFSASKKSLPIPGVKITEDFFIKNIISELDESSRFSSDWWRQISGAIVKDKKVLITSFNKHLPNEDSNSVVGDPRTNFNAGENIDIYTSIHAEAGLIAEAAKKGLSLKGSEICVTTFPCPNCAKLIALSGISRVYFKEGYSLLDAADTLSAFGVQIVKVE